MLLGTSFAFFFGLSAVATGLRLAEGDASDTTSFVITVFTYYTDSKVNCVAEENLRIRSPDGTTREVVQGEKMFSQDVGVQDDSKDRYKLPHLFEQMLWWIRQAATLEVELEDPADRHIPQFRCEVHNSVSNGLECQGGSTGNVPVNSPRRCAVEIEHTRNAIDFEINHNDKESGDVDTAQESTKFYVKGWTTIGESTLHCVSNMDPVGENRETNLKDTDLFVAANLKERETIPQEVIPKVWEIVQDVVILKTSDLQNNGFICKIVKEGNNLCQANSWEPTVDMVATQPDGCLVKITRDANDLVVQYPTGFFRGWTSFSVRARAWVSTESRKLILECRGLTDMILENGRTGPGHMVRQNMPLLQKNVVDWRDRKMRLYFRAFNKYVDRFVCTVTEHGKKLCEANSWDINAPVSQEQYVVCQVQITEIGV